MEMQQKFRLVTAVVHPVLPKTLEVTARLTLDEFMTDAELVSAWHTFREVANISNAERFAEYVEEELEISAERERDRDVRKRLEG